MADKTAPNVVGARKAAADHEAEAFQAFGSALGAVGLAAVVLLENGDMRTISGTCCIAEQEDDVVATLCTDGAALLAAWCRERLQSMGWSDERISEAFAASHAFVADGARSSPPTKCGCRVFFDEPEPDCSVCKGTGVVYPPTRSTEEP